MIKHAVIFKLNHPEGSLKEKEFFVAASKLADIPGVKNFEILKQTSTGTNFDFGIVMEFSNHLLYQQYTDHEEHKQFLQHHWLKGVQDFLEIDYEPLPAF